MVSAADYYPTYPRASRANPLLNKDGDRRWPPNARKSFLSRKLGILFFLLLIQALTAQSANLPSVRWMKNDCANWVLPQISISARAPRFTFMPLDDARSMFVHLSPFIGPSLFGRSWLARVSANQSRRIFRANISQQRNEMNTGPEETSEENPEKKEKIQRVPEGTFGGTRDRLSEVEGDEPAPDDTGDQGHGQN